MGYLEIEPVPFGLQDSTTIYSGYTSSVTRLWYAHFQADEEYAKKPLFVFLNGGPGCGTSMNLFSMNTAPYTLDRNTMASNELFRVNPHTWTRMGNLLYIDAPNTGFSYMAPDRDWVLFDWLHIWKFVGGDNFQPFIDAAQVLRGILQFLASHPELKSNEVILVGESYSGVRVTTLLNLLVYHDAYARGTKVYHDAGLATVLTNHFKSVLGKEPPFLPEDVVTQFGRQILIQPQIVDKYQGPDMNVFFQQPDSDIARLGYEARATNSWENYLHTRYGGTSSFSAIHGYLDQIDRDPYHAHQDAKWTDDNEYYSMKRLNDFNALETITGHCSPSNVPHLWPAARTHALKFAVAQEFFSTPLIRWIVDQYFSEDQKKMLESMVPGWRTGQADMDYNPDDLKFRLGELSGRDAYVTGTNPYVYLGFMMNSGGWNIPMLVYALLTDPYDISAGKSDRYGRMFLENLAVVDTFMTDAKYDYVVYSPTLVSQFQGSRFSNYVARITQAQGNSTRRYGSFTVDYKTNAIADLQQTPACRTVSWRYYGESGHAVSASQPSEFREDVEFWLHNRWYNVTPREGGVAGGTEVTIYGEDLCVDAADVLSVTVGGQLAEVLSAESGRITFRTPPLPQGPGNVVIVSRVYGTLAATNAFCAKLPQWIGVQSPVDSVAFGVNDRIDCLATSSVPHLPVSFSVSTTDPVDGLTNGATWFSMPVASTASICFEQPGDDYWFAAEPALRYIAVTSNVAKTYHVAVDGDDSRHGLIWSQAKRTLQAAAERAVQGDVILVSNGVYDVSSAVQDGTNRVVVGEGVTMRSVQGADVTFIEGAGLMRGVYLKAGAQLEGFTVRHGRLSGAPSHWKERAGAGVFVSTRAQVVRCIIQSNAIALTSSDYALGGGLCLENNAQVRQSLVLDNAASTSGAYSLGGGIAVASGSTNCWMDNVVVAGNQTLHEGGGIYLDEQTQGIHLMNCTITGNHAPNNGSGFFAYGSSHGIHNSILYGNTGASDLYIYNPNTVSYTNSCVPSTSGYGHFVNVVTNNPQLVSQPRGMIGPSSPCRDRGATGLSTIATDVGQRPRVINQVVDIGAYEYQRWLLSGAQGKLLWPDDIPSVTNGTDFGTVDFGVSATNRIFVRNVSSETLIVHVVLQGDDVEAFALEGPSQIQLGANSSTNIDFVFLANREGSNAVELCVTDFGLTSFVRVSGFVKGKSTLSQPADLSFECQYNYLEPEPQLFAISNSGPSDCSWRVERSAAWMHALPESAVLAAGRALTNLVAYVVPGDLPAGTYVSTNRFVSSSAGVVTQRVTLTITRRPITLLLEDEWREYDGTGKSVSVETVPAGLPVAMTYNGSTGLPVNVGTYDVVSTVDTPNYFGEETVVLTIEKGTQTIDFPQQGLLDARYGIDLSAAASSGLPVSFFIQEMFPTNELDRAFLHQGYQLRFQMGAEWAELKVVAQQAGNDNWRARSVTNAFQVTDKRAFDSWTAEIFDPVLRGPMDCPSGDGIPNLMKYALGLDPQQTNTPEDVFTCLLTSNEMGEVGLRMTYLLSTKTENVQTDPIQSVFLVAPDWNTTGIVKTPLGVIEGYELWQAFLSTALTNHAFMGLRVRSEGNISK